MNDLAKVEDFLVDSFKVLDGLPNYIGIEELDNIPFNDEKIESKLKRLISLCKELQIKRISVKVNRTAEHYHDLSRILKSLGFEAYAAKVEFYRNLHDLELSGQFEWGSLSDGTFSEQEFMHYWERCMSGSQNVPTNLTVDEHLDSVKSELGEGWQSSCKVAYLEGKPIGVAIPHIEPGTTDEGRMFYFGLLPEARGKGLSTSFHLQSLSWLKRMGASYYIGNTHETNKPMQKVFMKNGCSIRTRTESYYKYFR